LEPEDLLNRVPPSSVEAEQSVLGAILIDQAVLDDVRDILVPSDFYAHGHRTTYISITELGDRDSRIDITTLIEWLTRKNEIDKAGGAAYIAGLPDRCPAAAHAGSYAKIVRDKAILRKLIAAAHEIASQAYSDPPGLEQFLSECQGTMFDIGQAQTDTQVDIPTAVTEAIKNIEELTTTGRLGLSTGLKDLDDKSHGLTPGDLHILAGRPGAGKTALALSILRHTVDNGGRAGLFSLEMGQASLVQRLINSEAGVRVKAGYALQKPEWESVMAAANKIRGVADRLLMDTASIITTTQIKSRARRWKSTGALDLLVVDYLQLVSNPLRNRSRESEVAEISKNMKALAKDLNCPILLLSQLNRSGETEDGKAPRLSALRESGAIEQDADMVFFIYSDKEDNNHIKVAKHRNGPTGEIDIHIDWATGCFRCVENQRTPYQDD